MRCPYCSYENIEGADQCTRCSVDLSHLALEPDGHDRGHDFLSRPLGELMAQDYLAVSPDAEIADVVSRFNETGDHVTIVVENDRIVGIFTERDLLTKVGDDYDSAQRSPIQSYMTPAPETLSKDDSVAFGLNRMMVGDYRHIPIEDDGKLVGVVSVRDILGFLVDRFPDLLEPAASAE